MGGQRVAHVLFNLSSSSATGIIIQSHHTVNNTKTTSLRLKSSVWYALGGLCASSHFLSDVQCCSLREFITSRPHPVLHSHLFKESKQRSVLHLLLAHPCIPCLKGLLPDAFIQLINFWSERPFKMLWFALELHIASYHFSFVSDVLLTHPSFFFAVNISTHHFVGFH